MNLTLRIWLHDLYLLHLVFLRFLCIGLGLVAGMFLTAMLIGIFRRIAS